jgi:hypothetical protein
MSTVEEEEEDPVLVRQRLESSTILRRNELLSLLTTFLVPCLGAYLLNYIRGLLSDPERYVNDSLIQMFMIATSVKPFLHFVKLLKRQSLYHQELVHYPNTQVHDLKLKLNKLESDLIQVNSLSSLFLCSFFSVLTTPLPRMIYFQLSRAFATKSDIRALRDGVDVPLSQLSKAFKRFSKKEEYLRLTSSEKFGLLEQRLEQVTELAEKQQEVLQEIELERRERELQEKEQRKGRKYNNSELDFGNFLGRLLGSVVVSTTTTTTSNSYNDDDDQIKGNNKQKKKWYERGLTWYVFWPITVPKSTIGWVLEKSGNAVKKIERGFVEETKEELNLNHNASLRGGGGGGGNNEKPSTRGGGVAGGSRRRNNALKA